MDELEAIVQSVRQSALSPDGSSLLPQIGPSDSDKQVGKVKYMYDIRSILLIKSFQLYGVVILWTLSEARIL